MRKNNTEFQKKKNVILFIFGYSCQLCGLISTSNHVHHIDRNHANNNAFNLVPLCDYCHKLTHKTAISIKLQYSSDTRSQLTRLNAYF